MSKEQEAFNRISEAMDYADDMASSHYEVGDFEIVENALKRLESIDNKNPSEALKSLENIYTFSEDVIYQFEKEYNIIKQTLQSINLLMQELGCKDMETLRKYARCGYEKINKKYLKWEDLEFIEEDKEIFALLNGTKYKLKCYKSGNEDTSIMIVLNGIVVADLCSIFYKADKQFFNDLRLERVEE